jgi:uncharacterized protein YdaT
MPWSNDRYPASMKNLAPAVRLKAIEIANALLDEGYDEGRCIRIAIARARQWARRRSGQFPGLANDRLRARTGRRPV